MDKRALLVMIEMLRVEKMRCFQINIRGLTFQRYFEVPDTGCLPLRLTCHSQLTHTRQSMLERSFNNFDFKPR